MKTVAAGILLCFGAATYQSAESPVRVERTVFLMGTMATFITEANDRESGVRRLERMVRVIEETEAELSTWRDDSVLSSLNQQPIGTSLILPSSVCVLLDQVTTWYRETAGAFDPAIGRLIDVWAIRGNGRIPDADMLTAAKSRSGFQHVLIDFERCTASRRLDVTIDAGGFGKGAALERVRKTEEHQPGAWLIDFGGQVAVSSSSLEGAWPVEVAHPVFRDIAVIELLLDGGSVATTGGSERDITIDSNTQIGHVIDPRTGLTVSRSSSVTVWHQNALVADILSTALYVMGIDDGVSWAETRGIAAYFIEANVETEAVVHEMTNAFEARFNVQIH